MGCCSSRGEGQGGRLLGEERGVPQERKTYGDPSQRENICGPKQGEKSGGTALAEKVGIPDFLIAKKDGASKIGVKFGSLLLGENNVNLWIAEKFVVPAIEGRVEGSVLGEAAPEKEVGRASHGGPIGGVGPGMCIEALGVEVGAPGVEVGGPGVEIEAPGVEVGALGVVVEVPGVEVEVPGVGVEALEQQGGSLAQQGDEIGSGAPAHHTARVRINVYVHLGSRWGGTILPSQGLFHLLKQS